MNALGKMAMRSNGVDIGERQGAQAGAWLYLDEITHRALNDYTAMLAIVRRAAEVVSDQASAMALAEVGIRLRASAMAYLALRPPQDGQMRDLSQELANLCTYISSSILSPRGIRLNLSSDPVAMSAFRCWQISLVVSELVTNAARHAFRQREAGAVTVKISVRDEILRCEIIDDGAADGVVSPGRGTAIVNALISDLGGAISREHFGTGSTIAFYVPLADRILIPKIDWSGKDRTPNSAIRLPADQQPANRDE
jgi:two-component sensor histidine kinase